MAGEAPDTGDSVIAGALTGIFSALTSVLQPEQKPIPVAPSLPQTQILGIPIGTVLLVGVGAFVLFKLLK